jgi:predicted ATPase
VTLSGFKSIKKMELEFRPVNVLIGANGAGKSNLVSFFSLLHELANERLQQWITGSGGVDSLLHLGPKNTLDIDISLNFMWTAVSSSIEAATPSVYNARLSFAAPDRLQFTSERLTTQYDHLSTPTCELDSKGGNSESVAYSTAISPPGNAVARHLTRFLRKCHVFHFHDTSGTARIRRGSLTGDARWLDRDGSNLAPLLYAFRNSNEPLYKRIVSTIRLLLPDFDDFVLEPDRVSAGKVLLFWRQTGSDYLLGPHQLSDGTLRAMCLITLLLQPENDLPELLIVDEPELGLHPYAIDVIASLFKKVSHHVQVLVSTQSPTFVDHFDPEDIIVVNRVGKESQFVRPDPQQLESWLEEYSLGEIWQKNVIGGGPH